MIYLLTAEGSLAPAPIPGSFQDPGGSQSGSVADTMPWAPLRGRGGEQRDERAGSSRAGKGHCSSFHSRHSSESWSSLPKANACIYHCQGDLLATQALLRVREGCPISTFHLPPPLESRAAQALRETMLHCFLNSSSTFPSTAFL